MGRQDKDTLYIQTLGDFTLTYKDKVLSGAMVHTKRVWSLLEYLIVNRYNDNSLDRLIEALWNVDDIGNPSNALKNLAYRLRTLLKSSLGIDANEYILSKHGSYAWNINASYVLDVDILENSVKNISKASMSIEDMCSRYEKAVSVYKGSFMPQASFKEWIIPLSVYYQNIYMSSVESLCDILLKRYDYIRVEAICQSAILFDSSVEINHANLIKAFIGQNDKEKALMHYNYVNKLFYDKLGIKPSSVITDLYDDITDKDSGYEKDISELKKDLMETDSAKGTMQCNFETFKDIYRLQRREALRNGKTVFIALLTIRPATDNMNYKDNLEAILDKVLRLVCRYLRKNDLVARCGKAQYVIMLSNITYENTVKVVNRIDKAIIDINFEKIVSMESQVDVLEPVEFAE